MHDRSVGNKFHSVIIDRKNCTQDEMADYIENSLDAIYISEKETFKPIAKEEVYNLDINKHRFRVNSKRNNTKVRDKVNDISRIDTSGICGYGLNLI